jgi:hypothetical protein
MVVRLRMYDLGKPKNSVGLKPNAELRKDAKAPSDNIGTELGISCFFINCEINEHLIDN